MRELEHARIAVSKEDWPLALEGLLVAWRKKRVVRIAELIDRVSERLPSDPIKAKTAKQRHAAWLDTSQTLDHASLGRLLATPFPGRWQDAVPIVTRLGEFRDDPRIAVALASFVAAEPYATMLHAGPLFRIATEIIARHREARAKATLEEHLQRTHSFYWQYREEQLVRSAVARMSETPPDVLDSKEEAALASVEAFFAAEIKADASAGKTEADFMAAIYAAPNEDMPRAVYADWLTEHGDPRGEFIALQLAPNPTVKSKKREAALLKKYGATWAGDFDRLFAQPGRRFRRGFLAGGMLGLDGPRPTVEDLRRPEWALFEEVFFTLDVVQTMRDDILSRPWLGTMRAMRGLDEETAALVARSGAATQLDELGLHFRESSKAANRKAIAAGFPNLGTLELRAGLETLEEVLEGPLPPRITRLRVRSAEYPLAALAHLLEKPTPNIELIEVEDGHLREDDRWHFELRRDAEGGFTRLRASTRNPSRALPAASSLSAIVESLPALTELVVERCGGCKWSSDEIARAEEAIASLKDLRVIEVPWDRAVGDGTNDEHRPRLDLTLYRPGGIARHLEPVWKALASRSISFDSMSVNDGAHQPIDGLEDVQNAFTKKRTKKVSVYAKRAPTLMRASFESWAFRVTMPRPDDLDAWLAWLVALVDRTDTQSLDVPFYGRDDDGHIVALIERSLGPRRESFRWLWAAGPSKAPFYDAGELEAAFVDSIPKTRVFRTKALRIFRLGDTPEDMPTDAQYAALDARITDAFWRRFEQDQGYTVPKLLDEVLAPALEPHGFVKASNGAWRRADEAAVVIHTDVAGSEVGMRAELESEGSSRWETITRVRAATADAARGALADFVARLDHLRWLR